MPGQATSWSLHPQLARDGVALGELPLSHVLVIVHVIARFRNDAAGPRPVWGQVPARPYAAADLDRLMQGLRPETELA